MQHLEEAHEEWEDTIQSFVPAFVSVKPKNLKEDENYFDAHLAIDADGQAIVRLLDSNEAVEIKVPLANLFKLDTSQYEDESWEMYFGLVEIMMQLEDMLDMFKKQVDTAGKIMDMRGFDMKLDRQLVAAE